MVHDRRAGGQPLGEGTDGNGRRGRGHSGGTRRGSGEGITRGGFTAKKFKWSVNLKSRSKVLVQISTEEIYREFPERSVPADIHGILMRVASLPDTLHGKILAWQDPERRASKRQKDLLDIMRLVEAHPKLRKLLPADVAKKIKE